MRQTIEDRIRDAGLRATRPRIAVLTAMAGMDHPDVNTITETVRAQAGPVSTQAVYDAVGALEGAGLLRRFEPAGSPARYDLRVGDNHHHLVCRSCGAVRDVDCAVGAAPCLAAGDPQGYVIDEAEVTYWGTCPDCR